MTEWYQILAVVLLVSIVFEYLTFYGGAATDFTIERYRKVAGHDDVAPKLEIALQVILAGSVWFIAVALFPHEGRRFLDERLWMPWFLILIGALAVAVLVQGLFFGPREAEELLGLRKSKPPKQWVRATFRRLAGKAPQEPVGRLPVYDTLHGETKSALDVLRATTEKRRRALVKGERWNNGLFYWVVGTTVFGLVALIAVLSAWGLWTDFRTASASRGLMRGAVPTATDSFDALYRQLEIFYASFRDYEIDLLELAKDLTGVLAVVFVISFFVFGTLTYTIYSRAGQFWSRAMVSVAVFFLFPLLIGVSYLSLMRANQEVVTTLDRVTAEVDIGALDNEQLAAFHDVDDRLRSQVDLPGFGSRLATSSGGFLLILGTILSLVQDRRSSTSFLRSIVPRRLWRAIRRKTGRWEKWGLILTPADELSDLRLVKAMKYAAVAIVGADGEEDKSEVAAAIEWINKKSSIQYDVTDFKSIKKEYRAEDLEAAFARVAKQLSMEEKELLVEGSIKLAAADQNIDDRELARIKEASRALGLSPAHFRHLTATMPNLATQSEPKSDS